MIEIPMYFIRKLLSCDIDAELRPRENSSRKIYLNKKTSFSKSCQNSDTLNSLFQLSNFVNFFFGNVCKLTKYDIFLNA